MSAFPYRNGRVGARPGVRRSRRSPSAVQDALFDVELRPERRYYKQMLEALTRSGFGSDVLAAEVAISRLFGTVWAGQDEPRDGSVEEAFGLGLVGYARGQRSPTALALLHAVAAVAPIREVRTAASLAASALGGEGLPQPLWTHVPGMVASGRCWAYEDVFGDQTVVLSEYAYGADIRVEERHGVMVQIDHVAYGAATNTTLVEGVDVTVRELQYEAQQNAPMFTLRQVDPAWARAIQARALARTDLIAGVPFWPRYAELRALALARLSALPLVGSALEPDPLAPGERARSAFVSEFLASPFAASLRDPMFAEAVARELIDYGCEHDPRRVLRVSPGMWESFLFDWWPSRAVPGPDLRSVVMAWSSWAAARADLPAEARDELALSLVETLDSLGESFGR